MARLLPEPLVSGPKVTPQSDSQSSSSAPPGANGLQSNSTGCGKRVKPPGKGQRRPQSSPGTGGHCQSAVERKANPSQGTRTTPAAPSLGELQLGLCRRSTAARGNNSALRKEGKASESHCSSPSPGNYETATASLGEHSILPRKCLSDPETGVPFPEIISPLQSPCFNESCCKRGIRALS